MSEERTMAFDAFLKIEGVDSEARRKGFEKQIEILSFSLGASNPTTIGSGGGGGSGKVSISSFNFMKRSDAASPVLFQACCDGTHYAKASVTLHKAGGKEAVDFIKYEFEEVFVESVQWSGSSGGDDVPVESCSFAFGKVTVTYTPQTAAGAKGSAVVGSWDLRAVTT
jgi:type VI secretion system secreted protein Hcp